MSRKTDPLLSGRLPAAAFSVAVEDLAYELGVDRWGVGARAQVLGIETRLRVLKDAPTKHRRTCVTPSDAQLLRDDYKRRTAPAQDIAHWLKAPDAARMLGLTRHAFYQRRLSGAIQVEQRQLTQITRRHFRYNPDDVRREAQRLGIHPRTLPAGALTTTGLMETLRVSRWAVKRWRHEGCPAHKLMDGDLYWKPAEVAVWLMSCHKAHMRARAERLLAQLQQRAA